MKQMILLLLAGTLSVWLLIGCGVSSGETSGPQPEQPSEYAEETADPEEEENTGDASLDDPRCQDGIGEAELLVVSFGTSYNDSRRLSIGGIEQALAAAFPAYSVRRAFTSDTIISHIARRDGVRIDNISAALNRSVDNGVKTLIIQPTHLMDGFEYRDLEAEAASWGDSFSTMALGKPLLSDPEDFQAVAAAVLAVTRDYDDGETAVCLMGHGTEAESNRVYESLQNTFTELGVSHCYVGTVEAEPSLGDVMDAMEAHKYRRVILLPLMIVAGDHAHNDMAGPDPDSWKSRLDAAGYETVCLMQGLGELPEIQALFVKHAQAAMDTAQRDADVAALPANYLTSEPPLRRCAEAADMAAVEDVAEAGLLPIYPDALREGTYSIEMKSSSSMFRAEHCRLIVSGGKLCAVLPMSSRSYSWLYAGSAQEAAGAQPGEYIAPLDPYGEALSSEKAELSGGSLLSGEEPLSGKTGAGEPETPDQLPLPTFLLPIEALDQGIPCAAYSAKKERWYDRTLLFRSDSLPPEAFAQSVTAESLGLRDGLYTAEVRLSGGSGRIRLESPAVLTVQAGTCMAEIVWDSPHYDYMKINGVLYYPIENADRMENQSVSIFSIPVTAFDRPLSVLADTTAMSQPHEIAYRLIFDAASLKPAAEAKAQGA